MSAARVADLAVGDSFGPINDDNRSLVVQAVRVPDLRGAGGGRRFLVDIQDQFGRWWRTGGQRIPSDCYGWQPLEGES